ncbi:MAG TPA: hypothetical protein DIC19_01110 [Erysipelotrichaceae bacterium]|nr:hypothetical protein [Erysipelotrichaceae bacterium]
MLSVKEKVFDPLIDDHFVIEKHLIQFQSNENVLLIDWTKCRLTPQEIIQTYLPIVEFAHELGYRVEVKIPLVLMSRFSYDADPIVFCGHTLNPFAFDDVHVIL